MNTQDLIHDLETLAQHEAGALAAHRAALHERWRVARRTRSLTELLRLQIDLLPLTTRRIADDHRRRVTLFRALFQHCIDPRPTIT